MRGEGAPKEIEFAVDREGGPVGFPTNTPDHMFLAGITRSGKTTLIKYLIAKAVRSGAGFTYATGKPTEEVLNTIYAIAQRCGRQSDFHVLNVNDPGRTMRWDPLFKHTTEEQAQIIKSLLTKEYFTGGAVYYTEMSTSFLLPVLEVLSATGCRYTILDVQAFLINPWVFLNLIGREEPGGSGASEYARERFRRAVRILEDELMRYRGDHQRRRDLEQSFDSLVHNIRFLTTPPYDAIFAPSVPDFTVLDCLQHNSILAVCLAALGKEDISMRVGRAWMASTKAAVGRVLDQLSYRKVDPVGNLALDEFASYAIPEAAVLFEQCREARIRLIPCVQTIERLQDPAMRLSEVFQKVVFENCRIKIFLKLGMYSAQIAEDYYGKQVRRFGSWSEADQKGHNFTYRLDNGLSSNKAIRTTKGYSEREAPVVPAIRFTQSNTWEAFIDRGDGRPIQASVLRMFDPPQGKPYALEHHGHKYNVGRCLGMYEKVMARIREKGSGLQRAA